MKFAQSSAVYFNYTLQYAIKDLHRLGYDGIEIWGGRPHMYKHDLDEQLPEIKSILNETGMKVCNFIPAQFKYPSNLFSPIESVRRDSVEYIKSAIYNAFLVGSPTVHLCGGMLPFDLDVKRGWNQLVKSYKELDEYVTDFDLKLLIEPAHRFESNLIVTVEDGLRMIDELKTENFGILIDTGHVHLNHEDYSQIIPQCHGIPLHVHIDDNCGDADSHLIPGKGNIDFNQFFQVLNENQYKGYVSAELGGGYCMDPTSACEETMTFFNQYEN